MSALMNIDHGLGQRSWIVFGVMLVTILEVLDVTIVNVALPHMMSQLSANTTQITWVVTAYVVSSAVIIPLTGFLSNRLGRKRLLLSAIFGFMLTSMLCGFAHSLLYMVGCRILQGILGAPLIPLSQAILRDSFPAHEHGKAMAIWGMGIMTAPILGPTLGGIITDTIGWRWIFYLNIPLCLLALIIIFWQVIETEIKKIPLDRFGLFLMIVGICSLQLFFDLGNEKGWFQSIEIESYFYTAIIMITWFVFHCLKTEHPLVNVRLFKNRNFSVSCLLALLFVGTVFSVATMMPIMLEKIMGYPAINAGNAMAPRGITSAIAMASIPFLLPLIGVKRFVITGIVITAAGGYAMSFFHTQSDWFHFVWPGLIQGFGIGLFFVPLSSIALSTLPKSVNTEASGLFAYSRNLGTSIGISVASTLVNHLTQVNWQELGMNIHPANPHMHYWLHHYMPQLPASKGLPVIAHVVLRESSMMAYVDTFWLISLGTLLLAPIALLLKEDEKLLKNISITE